MSVKMRQIVERRIVQAVVRDCLAAGYALNVDNGGDDLELPEPTTDRKTIMGVMMAADEDRLYVYRLRKKGDRAYSRSARLEGNTTKDWVDIGWVYFVYGNGGYDVVSDFTMNLGPLGVLKNAEKLAERYGG